jgi:hypothetical protein
MMEEQGVRVKPSISCPARHRAGRSGPNSAEPNACISMLRVSSSCSGFQTDVCGAFRQRPPSASGQYTGVILLRMHELPRTCQKPLRRLPPFTVGSRQYLPSGSIWVATEIPASAGSLRAHHAEYAGSFRTQRPSGLKLMMRAQRPIFRRQKAIGFNQTVDPFTGIHTGQTRVVGTQMFVRCAFHNGGKPPLPPAF